MFSITMLLDQSTKQLAIEHRPLLPQTSYLYGLIRFRYAENTGLFSSFGDGFSEPVKFWLFTVLVSVLLIILLVYSIANPKLPGWISAAIATISGGGMSNVLDRFQHHGAVIDFVYINLFDYRSGIFNLADAMITLGSLVILLYALNRLATKPKSDV